MKSAKVRVYLEDEAPRIGCGWRTVIVRIGRKWAYILDPYNGNKARLPKAKAEAIIRSISPSTE